MKFDNKFEKFFEKFTEFWGNSSFDLLSFDKNTFTDINNLLKDYQNDMNDEETKQELIKKIAEIALPILTFKKMLGDKAVEKEIENLMKDELKLINNLSQSKKSNDEQENEQI